MILNFNKIAAILAVCLMASPVFAQVAQETAKITPQASTATLSSDGQLTGSVITATADQVPNAQVSLVSQGKVIDSVTADASGNFSFANVHPGPYQLVGTAAGMLGSNALTVAPFVASQPVTPGSITLQPSTPQVMYDSVGSAPVAALSGCSTCNAAPAPTPCSTCNACSTCGGGGFGGGSFGGNFGGGSFGSRLGGRLVGGGRGGLLSGPRGLLVVGGLVGGLVAIDDASPDQ